jgi:hypothetical protein
VCAERRGREGMGGERVGERGVRGVGGGGRVIVIAAIR